MKDFLKGLWEVVYARLSNPLLFSFVLSWLAWNHRYLFILFSDHKVEYRFTLAHELLYPTNEALWWNNLWWPLLTSAGYVFVYPFAERWIFEFWQWRQIVLKEVRDRIEKATPLTKEEGQRIMVNAIKQRAESDAMIARLTQEIDALRQSQSRPKGQSVDELIEAQRQRIADLEGEVATRNRERAQSKQKPSDPLFNLEPEIVDGVIQVIKHLAVATGNRQQIDDLRRNLKVQGILAQHYIDEAIDRGLIAMESNNVVAALTKQGRAFAVSHKLFP